MIKERLSIRILVVEDSENDYLLLLQHLKKLGMVVDSIRVDTSEEFRIALQQRAWDCVLSDQQMPRFSALAALTILKEEDLDIPFILVSGTIGEDLAVEAMRSGAHDYISKSSLTRLGPAIERELREANGREQQRKAESERKTAELALRESEERYRLLVEQSPDGILMECDGKLVFANEAATRIFAAPGQAELLSKNFLDLAHPKDRQKVQTYCSQVKLGYVYLPTLSIKMLRLDGNHIMVEISANISRFAGSLAVEFVVRDLTERRNLEAQLLQSQKMEAVGQLAAGVAHDFNNVLTIIQGHVGLLQIRHAKEPSLLEPLNKIAMAADRASALTRQLLTFSYKQVIEPCVLDLNEVIETVLGMLQRLLREDVTLRFQAHPKLPSLYGDSGMMEQIIMNLAVNSRDAMPKGGDLTIVTEHVVLDEDFVQRQPNARSGSFVKLSIADTGTGMDAQTITRIFEPFFTTKEVGKGTGLGLATVYAIVRQHQGWIHVESALGEGTCFQIYLPASEIQQRQGRKLPVEQAAGRGKGELILVVEDEPVVLSLVRQILEENGYRVVQAETGVRALGIWSEHSKKVKLLLTDMVMPDGMTGQDLAERLIKDRPDLRVVFTSGYSDELGKSMAAWRTASFLQKPYQPEKLLGVIRQSLDQEA